VKGGRDPGSRERSDGPGRAPSPFRHLHLGTQIAVALLLGLLGGDWLDARTGWSPVFTLVGAFLGMGLGMAVVIREVGKDTQR
jgi:F0F1-type ATP synthase assembly protein I